MAPPHVSTFQRFNDRIDDPLEASVAFGLFMEAEWEWAAEQGNPSDTQYRRYQRDALTDRYIDMFRDNARVVLSKFGSEAVAARRIEILQQALRRYEAAAARGHGKFRKWGVVEAFFGAFAWTLALILFAFVLNYAGIDVIEVFHKVAGH
jgi:hypothetical protein